MEEHLPPDMADADDTNVNIRELGTSPIDEGDRPGLFIERNRENIRIIGDIFSPMPPKWFERLGQKDSLFDPIG